LDQPHQKKFSTDFLYFSLISDGAQAIEIKFEFGDSDQNKTSINKLGDLLKRPEKRKLSIENMSNIELFREISRFLQKKFLKDFNYLANGIKSSLFEREVLVRDGKISKFKKKGFYI
jgi:hypothetical protein